MTVNWKSSKHTMLQLTLSDLQNSYIENGLAQVKFCKSELSICMVNPLHLHNGVQVKSRLLCIGIWLALAWLSCCLHYGPSSLFYHLGWTVLLLSQEKKFIHLYFIIKMICAW